MSGADNDWQLTPEDVAKLIKGAATHRDVLSWQIFQSPPGYEGLFVARPYSFRVGTLFRMVVHGRTIEEVRSKLPPDLVCAAKSSIHQPDVLETWL